MANLQNKMAPVQGVAAPAAAGYSEALQKILMGSDQRQYNLQAVKQRVDDLYNGLNDITVALQNISHPILWNDVLSKFVVLSIQYGNVMQQLRGILKNAVVHPKLVDSGVMSSVLPLQLSTFPLPEMQQAEAQLNKRVQHELQAKPAGQACLQLHDAIDNHNRLVDHLTLASNTDATAGILDPQGKAMRDLKAASKKLTAQVNDLMARRAAAGSGGMAGAAAARKGQTAGKAAGAKRKRDPQEELVEMFLVGQGLTAPAQAQGPSRR